MREGQRRRGEVRARRMPRARHPISCSMRKKGSARIRNCYGAALIVVLWFLAQFWRRFHDCFGGRGRRATTPTPAKIARRHCFAYASSARSARYWTAAKRSVVATRATLDDSAAVTHFAVNCLSCSPGEDRPVTVPEQNALRRRSHVLPLEVFVYVHRQLAELVNIDRLAVFAFGLAQEAPFRGFEDDVKFELAFLYGWAVKPRFLTPSMMAFSSALPFSYRSALSLPEFFNC